MFSLLFLPWTSFVDAPISHGSEGAAKGQIFLGIGGCLTGALKLKCNAIAAAAISGIIVMVVISNVKGRRSRPL